MHDRLHPLVGYSSWGTGAHEFAGDIELEARSGLGFLYGDARHDVTRSQPENEAIRVLKHVDTL